MSHDRRTPPFIRSSTNLDDILKGEILSRLAGTPSPEVIDMMAADARRRFGPNAAWTIGALEVIYVSYQARGRLQAAFEEFRKAGGNLIIVVTTFPRVAVPFQLAAFHAGNIEILIVKTAQEATEAAKKRRDAPKT